MGGRGWGFRYQTVINKQAACGVELNRWTDPSTARYNASVFIFTAQRTLSYAVLWERYWRPC